MREARAGGHVLVDWCARCFHGVLHSSPTSRRRRWWKLRLSLWPDPPPLPPWWDVCPPPRHRRRGHLPLRKLPLRAFARWLGLGFRDTGLVFRVTSWARGRPRRKWIDNIRDDCSDLGLTLVEAICCLQCFDTVGRQEGHPACKNWVMRCWCGYLSGVMCKLFAYGPADATAISKPHHLLPHLNPDWFYLSCTSLHELSWKRDR